MQVIYGRDYQILPDSEECQIERICRMFSEHPENTRFVLETGVYHFYKNNGIKRRFSVSNSDQADELSIAILLEHMHDVVIDGQGAQFIFHGDMTPIVVTDCRQVELKRFSIDFAIPMSAEARILKVQEDFVDIYLDSELFPHVIQEEQLWFERGFGEKAPLFAAMEFDGQTNRVPEGKGDTFPKVRAFQREKDVVRLTGIFSVMPTPGNTLVLRHGKRIHPGMLVQCSEDVLVEAVTVHQTAGLGILFQFNKNISVYKVAFSPNTVRGCRFLNGHDDGLHFSNNCGKIQVKQCSFRGLMDDAVNVHGTAACVLTKKDWHTLIGSFCHPQSVGFERWAKKGDEIAFLDPSDRSCYTTAIVSAYRLLSPTEFELCTEKELPEHLQPKDALENLTNTPEVNISDSYFGSHRARGILVTTPKAVRIEQNIFESSGAAILLAGDVNEWYESGSCKGVLIKGNRFLHCCTSKYQFCDGVIHSEPGVKEGKDAIVHENIRIEDNVFFLDSAALLYADHTADVTLKGNFIFRSRKTENPKLILQKCRNILYEENIIDTVDSRDCFQIGEERETW